MIKRLIIKKIAIFSTALAFTIIVSCGTKDDKNIIEPYPTSDTNKVEHKNDPLVNDSLNSRTP
jgi:hypothetical protein